MDPTRPVNAGVHLTTKFDSELENCFDVFGMNYWQDRYDKMHSAYPNLPSDLSWTGDINVAGGNDLYRNSLTDTNNASDWSSRGGPADEGAPHPGQEVKLDLFNRNSIKRGENVYYLGRNKF